MAHEKIVTLFDTATQAEAAKKNLIKAGFPDRDISLISGERLQSEGKAIRHPSIWQRLFGETVDREYADVYSEAMDKGGVIVSLRAAEEDVAKAMTILYSHDSVDVPSRARRDVVADSTSQNREFAGETNDREPRTSLTGDESEEEILRLAQEKLEVGKRLISEGSTRVRRYVVTDQVSENISLHEQHADIFRRSVDEPAYHGDIDWSEKTVEIAESHEQPVINKTARVKEEVVVRKDTRDHVETINDTVRRQEIDIDKTGTPGAANVTDPTGTATANTANRTDTANATATTANAANLTGGANTASTANTTGSASRDFIEADNAGLNSTRTGSAHATGNGQNNGKPGMAEKVSEKVSEAKDKVEGKLKQHDHSH